ncbi:helix-turn-helix domain-containing protein [Granulosicoccus sp.]|nr:helix-turn-helix domain-containing protein [Granulosicoccus sp.]MDB4222359.1 helix-turn-helix domain-containing protein [Granulosicoccus sp.]
MANYNPNRVKLNRSYTLEELAAVFGVHKNTVSSWVKNGLPCLKERRPFLILGAEARIYLQKRRTVKKQQCKPDELFCMRCKTPKRAAENYVEYLPLSATKGRLTGFCERCESVVNKFVSLDSLPRYAVLFDLSLPKALEHINDSDCSLLNSDFK